MKNGEFKGKLETEICYIKTDIAEIKDDIKEMKEHLATMHDDVTGLKIKAATYGTLAGGGISIAVALFLHFI